MATLGMRHAVLSVADPQDLDGIEFEIMWELPLELYHPDAPSNVPLDLEADIARWGADRPSRTHQNELRAANMSG